MQSDHSLLTLKSYLQGIENKQFTPEEIKNYYLNRIKKDLQDEKSINAIIHFDEESIEHQLNKLSIDSPLLEKSLLKGACIAIKDNIHMQGQPVGCASRIMEGYISPYNAGVVERLLNHGAIILGRTNMDEFAMGSSNKTSFFGVTCNPIDREYITGGSSGGSAAAVAADFCLAALGSDTGGSIRQPAGMCGIVGLKPTYGIVSRHGLVAFASSMDQIGPLTKNVEDAAIMMNVISGHDIKDSTSLTKKYKSVYSKDYTAKLNNSLKGKKIGIPVEYYSNDVDSQILQALEKVKDFYQKAGCTLIDVSLSQTEYSVPCYYILATAEASTNLARFDGIHYGSRAKKSDNLKQFYFKTRNQGFGLEVKRRILLGSHVLSAGYYDAYYVKAQKIRRLIRDDFIQVFDHCDILLTPITPDLVSKLDDELSKEPVKTYLADIFTIGANLAGLPAMTLPTSKDSNGLPIGFQLIGPHFRESSLLNFAHIFEKENRVDFVPLRN